MEEKVLKMDPKTQLVEETFESLLRFEAKEQRDILMDIENRLIQHHQLNLKEAQENLEIAINKLDDFSHGSGPRPAKDTEYFHNLKPSR